MTHLSYPALALFLQAASPADLPVSAASVLIVVAAVVLGFLGGCLLTAIFFLAKRREKPASSFQNPATDNTDKRRISIKHCSQCDSTYTDEEIGYCLRDGMLLKVVGTMPVPQDPDETRVINRNR